MGQCGCGDFSPFIQMPGPNGSLYLLQVYPSCSDCRTPAGVLIYNFSVADAREWADSLSRVPTLIDIANKQQAVISEGVFMPVLEPKILKEKMLEFASQVGHQYDLDGFSQDAVDECLKDAIVDTSQAWLSELIK